MQSATFVAPVCLPNAKRNRKNIRTEKETEKKASENAVCCQCSHFLFEDLAAQFLMITPNAMQCFAFAVCAEKAEKCTRGIVVVNLMRCNAPNSCFVGSRT